MGSSLARQAASKGIEVVATSKEIADRAQLQRSGISLVDGIEPLIGKLTPPRKVFLYIPAGPVVDSVLTLLEPLLAAGDVVVDGGNSHFRDSAARQARLAAIGIGFVDCGSSGGPVGALTGACFMVGGESKDVALVEPILRMLSVADGFIHAGAPGTGHFVKLVHNAIEFGMVQAIGEGMALIRASGYLVDLPALLRNWQHGSVIRGWLIELMEKGLRENPDLEKISDYVEDTGEVNWAVEEALRLEVPIPVINASVMELFHSRDKKAIAHRSVAVLRHEFGGHPFGADPAIAHERQTGKVGLEMPSSEVPKKSAA